MFSMHICTKYECLMSGTNSLAETDRRPIDVCPECMAKIAWLSKIDPETRYKHLADFAGKMVGTKRLSILIRSPRPSGIRQSRP
jgi:archaemetzincin